MFHNTLNPIGFEKKKLVKGQPFEFEWGRGGMEFL